jgi:hypothetical protein
MNPINKQIVKLWNKYFPDSAEVYAPLFYNKFVTGGIVFVGINPSFSEHAHKHIFRETELGTKDSSKFFLWKNIANNQDNIKLCLESERLAHEKHSYFKPFRNIAEELNVPHEHLDLFLYKLTSQEQFKKLIYDNGELNQFALDQLDIFYDALAKTKPKVIVIANAHGAEIVNNRFSELLRYDKKKGFHYFTLNNGTEAPIFFSSMLSGQRSLDVWSRQRLQWHIGKAIKG